jgi:hypothetical protein
MANRLGKTGRHSGMLANGDSLAKVELVMAAEEVLEKIHQ